MEDVNYGQDPQGRLRFFGIYSAKVTNINDPISKNRIEVQIFQTTGTEISGWAKACLPITSNANHPDHQEHTAAQIAVLLTTTSVTAADPQGGSVTIPALTVVAKAGAGTLKHLHKTTVNAAKKWNESYGTIYNDSTNTDEHTPHRLNPKIGQLVWVMFEGGDPEYPVWIGVQS